MEVVEFETGPFLAEDTEPKMRKGVASRFLTDLPIGWLTFLANKKNSTVLQNCLSEKCRIKYAK